MLSSVQPTPLTSLDHVADRVNPRERGTALPQICSEIIQARWKVVQSSEFKVQQSEHSDLIQRSCKLMDHGQGNIWPCESTCKQHASGQYACVQQDMYLSFKSGDPGGTVGMFLSQHYQKTTLVHIEMLWPCQNAHSSHRHTSVGHFLTSHNSCWLAIVKTKVQTRAHPAGDEWWQ